MKRYRVSIKGNHITYNTHITAENKKEVEKAVREVYQGSEFKVTIEEIGATTERGVNYIR